MRTKTERTARAVWHTARQHIGRDWSPDPASLFLLRELAGAIKTQNQKEMRALTADFRALWPELRGVKCRRR